MPDRAERVSTALAAVLIIHDEVLLIKNLFAATARTAAAERMLPIPVTVGQPVRPVTGVRVMQTAAVQQRAVTVITTVRRDVPTERVRLLRIVPIHVAIIVR